MGETNNMYRGIYHHAVGMLLQGQALLQTAPWLRGAQAHGWSQPLGAAHTAPFSRNWVSGTVPSHTAQLMRWDWP